MQNLVECYFN